MCQLSDENFTRFSETIQPAGDKVRISCSEKSKKLVQTWDCSIGLTESWIISFSSLQASNLAGSLVLAEMFRTNTETTSVLGKVGVF